jgi:3-oxoacyl-[acyl-carrier protein] reductase
MTMSAYGPSKGALNAFTRYAALQFAPHRIRCNALVLPVVLTKGLESLFTRQQIEDVVSRTPFREPTRPADVAAVAEFLASDDARLITGKLWEI